MTTDQVWTPGANPDPSRFDAWLGAVRPKTLPAALIPVLVGISIAAARHQLHWGPSVAMLVATLLLQVASNFANDVYDFERGADNAARLGPRRSVSAGLIAPSSMKRALWTTLVLSATLAVYLTTVAGPWVLAVGALSMLVAVAYTGGPFPLGYNGLGDVCVFLFFGVTVVTGTAYLNLGEIPPLAWLCSVPMGTLTTAILVVNNVRDVETDREAAKRTLVVLLGRAAGLWEYRLLLLSAFLSLWPICFVAQSAWLVLPLLSAPLAISLERELSTAPPRALNATLAKTAKLLTVFGLLLALGVLLGRDHSLTAGL